MDSLKDNQNSQESLISILPDKRFTHISFQFPKLQKVDVNGTRHYLTPEGKKYPSVTSVTSIHNEKNIIEWRARVGSQEANRISRYSSGRGTKIHKWVESILLNDGFTYDPENIADSAFAQDFRNFVPLLNKIDNIFALETPVFSHELETAGTVDCIAQYENKMSVIDFKTATRPKKKEHIFNYFMQLAAYAHCYKERTGQEIVKGVLLFLVDGGETQVFIDKPQNYLEMFRHYRREWQKRNS